jgi:L-iditol 2-dehydrogenase
MQVARVHGAGDLRLHDEPIPTPGTGAALVRVTSVGVCGSDVHWWKEGGLGGDKIVTPLVSGHESAGVIESGKRSGEHPASACGRCEFCQEGNPNLSVRVFGCGAIGFSVIQVARGRCDANLCH